jgi:hypothetical protein
MKNILERTILVAELGAFFAIGYVGVALTKSLGSEHVLGTPLDTRIPFVAWSVWVYFLGFFIPFAPVFIVRSRVLLSRTATAYGAVIAISLISFASFRVTSEWLRVPLAHLDPTQLSERAVALLYHIDPYYNLFPSLHVSLNVLAAFSTWKASKRIGLVLFVAASFVGASVCTVKQHFVADALGGIALAAVVAAVSFRFEPHDRVVGAYSWQGPATYCVLVVSAYAVLYRLGAR